MVKRPKNPRGPVAVATHAAVYMRMSTDHQRYSIANQIDVLAAYALAHNITVVSAYADEGKSGVRLRGLTGLQALLADAQKADCPYNTVLILDVSRWGRFQNTDESAYYEFLCWQAGVSLIYCGESFDNDGSAMSSLLKGLKRVMAGEYSRDLSRRIAAGKIQAARRGGFAGGKAPYGLRRVLFDSNNVERHALKSGERKGFATDTIRLAPGPAEEVAVLVRIFTWFGAEGRGIRWIINTLNAEHVCSPMGGKWTIGTLRSTLSNEAYVGMHVYNRNNTLMKEGRFARPTSEHVRVSGIFSPLINPALFAAASKRNQERWRPKTNLQLIGHLRDLHAKYGELSMQIINAEPDVPHHQTYLNHFGSLLAAYQAAGVMKRKDHRQFYLREQIASLTLSLMTRVTVLLERAGHRVNVENRKILKIDGAWRLGFRTALHHKRPDGDTNWRFQIVPQADVYLATCLNAASDGAECHFLFLASAVQGMVVINELNDEITEGHWLSDLADIEAMAMRLRHGDIPQPVGRIGRTEATYFEAKREGYVPLGRSHK